MSISIVYESTSTTAVNLESDRRSLIQPLLEYIVEFLTDNPTVEVYDEVTTSGSGKTFTDVRMEIKFVDQAQLDLYLSDSRNLKSTVEGFNADPAIISFLAANGCTLNTSIVNDSTTARGKVDIADLATTIASYF